MGDQGYGIDPEQIAGVARVVKGATDRDVEVAVVVGAGNIFRGVIGAASGMDRATADYMGMIATMLNALASQDAEPFWRSAVASWRCSWPRTSLLPSCPRRRQWCPSLLLGSKT